MRRMFTAIGLGTGFLALAMAAEYAKDGMPSFDCTKASTASEKTICERFMGTALADTMVAEAFTDALAAPGADKAKLKADQKAFLKTRDACGDKPECITDATLDRIRALVPKGRIAGRYLYGGSRDDGTMVMIEGRDGRTGLWLMTYNGDFSCGLDTLGGLRQGSTVILDEKDGDGVQCHATFALSKDGRTIALESECRTACGMNGWMDGDYTLTE